MVYEVADIVHRVVGCGIEFVDGEAATFVETAARFALTASVALGGGVEAVDALGEDACAGGLSHSSGAAEEVGVCQLLACDGIFEGGGDVALAHDRFECLWAIFASRNYKVVLHLLCACLLVRYNLTKILQRVES